MDKLDPVRLESSERGEDFLKWQEYLTKLTCAVYKITPEKIGEAIDMEKKIKKPKVKRPGIHSKNKSSMSKTSKNYKKQYKGQG
jgi:hypothetical protein